MDILIFPRYDTNQASTRVRVMQFLPYLRGEDIEVETFPIIDSNAISGNSSGLTFLKSRLKSYLKVIKRLWTERGNKVLIHIHYELFPYLPFWFEYGFIHTLCRKKYIVEYDDAWFHRYNANKSIIVRLFLAKKIFKLMRYSELVIAGNKYIADYAKETGTKKIETIPTVVDVEKYKNHPLSTNHQKIEFNQFFEQTLNEKNYLAGKPIIGWIGTPSTTRFLLHIQNVIKTIWENGMANFVVIGADKSMLNELPINVIPWSEQAELSTLYKFDIGIMPLTDSFFERGKCGYKLIQYMACGLPVVASPVGVNTEIVVHGKTGYLASNEEEWLTFLIQLINDVALRKTMGHEGLIRAENHYSLKVMAPKYVSLIKNALSSIL